MLAVAATLLVGMWAGLLRLGWNIPGYQPGWAGNHGPLMVSGVLGTLICLERAVALAAGFKLRAAFLVPALTGIGGLLLLADVPGAPPRIFITLGSFGLVAIFAFILSRQKANFTVVMALGAIAWAIGNLLWLAGQPVFNIVYWWAAFLVLTIVGERLELARVARLTVWRQRLFMLAVGVFLTGVVLTVVNLDIGSRLAGLGSILLAGWLARYDIARLTIRRAGLPRYIAACLLIGYGWLAVSGVISIHFGALYAGPTYDGFLHALFLGFVFSMIFGHMPIILPAITGQSVAYIPAFYLHLALLHGSLAVRVFADFSQQHALRQWGGLFNVTAVLLFVALTAFGLVTARRQARATTPVAAATGRS